MSPRVLAWGLPLALAAAAVALVPAEDAPRTHPLARLVRPFADLASDIAWIRYQRALLAGDRARALRLAETALELDPTATEGWSLLATHLGAFLASPEREPDPARRLAFLRAGLAVTERGAERAERPQELLLLRGLLLQTRAELDPEIWPGGAPALWDAAAEAFARAQEAGLEDAGALRRHALERAAE